MVDHSKRQDVDPNDHTNGHERPNKRARMDIDSADEQGDASNPEYVSDEKSLLDLDDEEEETPYQPEETRPSDLYLDTVILFAALYCGC